MLRIEIEQPRAKSSKGAFEEFLRIFIRELASNDIGFVVLMLILRFLRCLEHVAIWSSWRGDRESFDCPLPFWQLLPALMLVFYITFAAKLVAILCGYSTITLFDTAASLQRINSHICEALDDTLREIEMQSQLSAAGNDPVKPVKPAKDKANPAKGKAQAIKRKANDVDAESKLSAGEADNKTESNKPKGSNGGTNATMEHSLSESGAADDSLQFDDACFANSTSESLSIMRAVTEVQDKFIS